MALLVIGEHEAGALKSATRNDRGAAISELLAAIAANGRSAEGSKLAPEGTRLVRATEEAGRAVEYPLASGQTDPRLPFGGAVPFLHLMGALVGADVLMRAARAAEARIAAGDNDPCWAARIGLARFYAAHVLPQVGAQFTAVLEGSATVFAVEEAQL